MNRALIDLNIEEEKIKTIGNPFRNPISSLHNLWTPHLQES